MWIKMVLGAVEVWQAATVTPEIPEMKMKGLYEQLYPCEKEVA